MSSQYSVGLRVGVILDGFKAEEETVKIDRRGPSLKHARLYHDR